MSNLGFYVENTEGV